MGRKLGDDDLRDHSMFNPHGGAPVGSIDDEVLASSPIPASFADLARVTADVK